MAHDSALLCGRAETSASFFFLPGSGGGACPQKGVPPCESIVFFSFFSPQHLTAFRNSVSGTFLVTPR